MLIVLFKSIIIGALAGFGIGAGVARMFHAPKSQSMGAFRTLGELNACQGDPVAHISFGLGFFLDSWASNIGVGAFSQDIAHRTIPNLTAGILMIKNKKPEETLHDPKKMAIMGAFVGAVIVAILNSTVAAIPDAMIGVAVSVLVPASQWLINPVMPVIFWLAAMDAGKRTGYWGTIFGGMAHIIMGNAVPGIVLGILLGKGVDDSGWNRITKTLFTSIIVLFTLSAFFRQIDIRLIQQLGLTVPGWLENLHNLFAIGG